MSFKNLFKILEGMHPLSTDLQRALIREMRRTSYPKKYLLHVAPEIAQYIYFIISGYAMSYFYDRGRKQVQKIWTKNHIVFLPLSFTEQLPSDEYIELPDQCEILYISHASITNLLREFPELNIIHRKIMNQYYDALNEKLKDMRLLTAHERFKKLLGKTPGIEKVMDQEDISSYLGITPQSLSRIKNFNR